MLAATIALLLSAVSAPRVDAAVAAALTLPSARAEVVGFRPAVGRGCEPEAVEAMRPVAASGDVPLRVTGRDARGAPCEGWGWAKVRVMAPALVALRPLRAGDPLLGAVSREEREVGPGHRLLSDVPAGAVAARAIQAGATIDGAAVRTGPRPGDRVVVRIRTGGLAVEQLARAVPCAPDRGCAVLPSGRHVEGRLTGDRIVLEAP